MADAIPDDTSTMATIVVGTPVLGTIDEAFDRDWYRIVLEAGTYRFDLGGQASGGGTLFDPQLFLHDSTGALLTRNDDRGGQGGRDSRLTLNLQAGTYFLAADSWYDDFFNDPIYETGTYTLSATLLFAANGAPTANNDARGVAEDATVLGNVVAGDTFGGVADTDPNGDVLTVVAVDGQAAGVGAAVQGDYGTLTLNADGSYSYTANADELDALPAGTTLSESFEYQISDGRGGTSTATLELTVTTVEDRITINGGNGVDRLQGGAGDEIIFGRNGADRLSGEGGADVLWGGNGDDELLGGTGIDRLIGEAGADRLTGGAGADTFVITKVTGTDTILDFASEDTIEITGFKGVNDFGDLRISTDGASTRVSFDGGTVVLDQLAQPLTVEDFIFG